ncbi:Galactose oxidase [Fusarium oxysporum f. sp. albedinis]|nr:Galactose oxidase [Fusarium oxysporum f. sp. albedinis]
MLLAIKDYISLAQMAHPIEPVTRQRDDKAQLAYGSRFWSLMSEELRSVCVRQLETASRWSRPGEGRGGALHLAVSI